MHDEKKAKPGKSMSDKLNDEMKKALDDEDGLDDRDDDGDLRHVRPCSVTATDVAGKSFHISAASVYELTEILFNLSNQGVIALAKHPGVVGDTIKSG